jgi:hypothetical protein
VSYSCQTTLQEHQSILRSSDNQRRPLNWWWSIRLVTSPMRGLRMSESRFKLGMPRCAKIYKIISRKIVRIWEVKLWSLKAWTYTLQTGVDELICVHVCDTERRTKYWSAAIHHNSPVWFAPFWSTCRPPEWYPLFFRAVALSLKVTSAMGKWMPYNYEISFMNLPGKSSSCCRPVTLQNHHSLKEKSCF